MTTTHHIKTTSATANVSVLRHFVTEILNHGRFERVGDLVHTDYRYDGPDGETFGRDTATMVTQLLSSGPLPS